MKNIILKFGNIVDPRKKDTPVMDIKIRGDRVEEIAKNITAGPSDRVFDISGKWIVTGTIGRCTVQQCRGIQICQEQLRK